MGLKNICRNKYLKTTFSSILDFRCFYLKNIQYTAITIIKGFNKQPLGIYTQSNF